MLRRGGAAGGDTLLAQTFHEKPKGSLQWYLSFGKSRRPAQSPMSSGGWRGFNPKKSPFLWTGRGRATGVSDKPQFGAVFGVVLGDEFFFYCCCQAVDNGCTIWVQVAGVAAPFYDLDQAFGVGAANRDEGAAKLINHLVLNFVNVVKPRNFVKEALNSLSDLHFDFARFSLHSDFRCFLANCARGAIGHCAAAFGVQRAVRLVGRAFSRAPDFGIFMRLPRRRQHPWQHEVCD
ncbi:MAG TPA: hypothetical protein ENK28_04900 [Aliiroseovarius sp.]|nr:hypothetical protein [Aliiroseovarius sp.]